MEGVNMNYRKQVLVIDFERPATKEDVDAAKTVTTYLNIGLEELETRHKASLSRFICNDEDDVIEHMLAELEDGNILPIDILFFAIGGYKLPMDEAKQRIGSVLEILKHLGDRDE